MNHRHLVMAICLSALLVGLLALPATAQAAPQLEPSIEFVTSGGWWQRDSTGGTYRIIVRSGGMEHIVSELFVQWLREEACFQCEPTIVATRPLREIVAGTWRFDAPILRPTKAGANLIVRGTLPHDPSVRR